MSDHIAAEIAKLQSERSRYRADVEMAFNKADGFDKELRAARAEIARLREVLKHGREAMRQVSELANVNSGTREIIVGIGNKFNEAIAPESSNPPVAAHAPMAYETFELMKAAVEAQCRATAEITADRDRLQAERDEYAKMCGKWAEQFASVIDERDKLKSENEHLQKLITAKDETAARVMDYLSHHDSSVFYWKEKAVEVRFPYPNTIHVFHALRTALTLGGKV